MYIYTYVYVLYKSLENIFNIAGGQVMQVLFFPVRLRKKESDLGESVVLQDAGADNSVMTEASHASHAIWEHSL